MKNIRPSQVFVFENETPCIKTMTSFQQAALYARLMDASIAGIPAIISVEHKGREAQILQACICGCSLSWLLEHQTCSDAEMLEMADSILQTLQALHAHQLFHGQIDADHIVRYKQQWYLLDYDPLRSSALPKQKETMCFGWQDGKKAPQGAKKDVDDFLKILHSISWTSPAGTRLKKEGYASAKQIRADLHSAMVIWPGINNPTPFMRVLSWLGILLCICIPWLLHLPAAGLKAICFRLWLTLAGLLGLFCLENTRLFYPWPKGSASIVVRLFYAVLTWAVVCGACFACLYWIQGFFSLLAGS